jgi:hypothetical protein
MIGIIKSRRMEWAMLVARMRKKEYIWCSGGKPKGKRTLGILRQICKFGLSVSVIHIQVA